MTRNGLKVQIERPAPCQHRLRIHAGAELIGPIREAVVHDMLREAVLPGFRKGKAPRGLVEQRHADAIKEETVRRATRHVFERVQQEHGLKPVGSFEVSKLEFHEATGLELEAQVEVEPEFKLGEYRGLPVTKGDAAVTPADVAKALAQLQESMAELVPPPAGGPEAGPPGGPGSGTLPQAGGGMVPASESPQKIKRVPALDQEFAKDMGFETLEQLRAHVEAKVREQRATQVKQALEQAVCDELLKRHTFEVPPGLVERQRERLTQDFQVRLMLAGVAEEQVTERLAHYTEQLKTNAVRQVKLSFILDRIAEQEQVGITQEEMVERLWTLAKRWGKDPVQVRQLLDQRGQWSSVQSAIRQDKTMRLVMDAARVVGAHPQGVNG